MLPPLGSLSLGLGISLGGVPVPVPGGGTGAGAPAQGSGHGVGHGSQERDFLEPQRSFNLSNRLGRSAMLVGQGQGVHAGGGHGGGGHGGGHGAGAQPHDGRLNFPFNRLHSPGLLSQQPEVYAGAQGLHPPPVLTATGAWWGGGGAGSAPASAADDTIRNAAFTNRPPNGRGNPASGPELRSVASTGERRIREEGVGNPGNLPGRGHGRAGDAAGAPRVGCAGEVASRDG